MQTAFYVADVMRDDELYQIEVSILSSVDGFGPMCAQILQKPK